MLERDIASVPRILAGDLNFTTMEESDPRSQGQVDMHAMATERPLFSSSPTWAAACLSRSVLLPRPRP
eukprot:551964-Alexandrium_andersonii.AAC.1